MCRVADLSEHGVVGGLQSHLQDADAVATVGDRRDDVSSALAVRFHMLALALQNAVVDAALQVDRLAVVRDITAIAPPALKGARRAHLTRLALLRMAPPFNPVQLEMQPL